MNPLVPILYLCGAVQFGILVASAMAPRVLRWNHHLASLPPLLRRMFWVYGCFIVFLILAFGILTFAFALEFAEGGPLARAVALIIALFWGLRLAVQCFVFDARPWLSPGLLRLGYHALTLAFLLLTSVYGYVAVRPLFP